MKRLLTFLLILITGYLHGQSSSVVSSIQSGNDFYRKGEYEKALDAYNRALQDEPENSIAKFNRAGTFYRMNRQTEAVQQFTALAREAKDKTLQAKSFYNKGVILSGQKNLQESIEAYKQALRLNPNDNEARENLQKALLELKKRTPPPKDEKKKDNKKQEKPKQCNPKLGQKEAEQRLKLLEQKEKEVQQRLQNDRLKTGSGNSKDW
jgi:Ca-activated chloride channel family protein